MTVLSTPIKNEIAMQKDIFRFAATLFAENTDVYSAIESQLQMIKCIFSANGNNYLTAAEVAELLYETYKYHISEEEVIKAFKKHRKTFEVATIDDSDSYRLVDNVFQETNELQKNNIDSFIDKYIAEFKIDDANGCKEAIHRYLYEITTTNIHSYRVLLYGKGESKYNESELSVNVGYLSDVEMRHVHDFIEWQDGSKNIALSNLVFACLEYCMLVNGDKPNNLLVDSIRKREIFLDTNILFRAIGINGKSRQHTVLSFLKKCKQAKLKLYVSHQTKMEFEDSIKYYIDQIKEYPRGEIYLGAYEQLSDYKMFSYYEDWKIEHPGLALRFFEYHINSQYDTLIKEYDISNDVKIPNALFESKEFKETRNRYTDSIRRKKQDAKSVYMSEDYHYSKRDSHDATVVTYIEALRDSEENEKDIFFVSSDKVLRFWDMDRADRQYPIVIYPSQLFLVLIKMCGRSENDFDSFVRFINIKPKKNQISAEKANIILAGISSITNDLETQKMLVSSICDGQYQDIIQNAEENDKLYQAIQSVCQKYLEEELKQKEEKIVSLQEHASNTAKQIESLEEISVEDKKEISSLRGQVEQQVSDINAKNKTIDEKNKEISEIHKKSEKHKEQICNFAEKKTRFGFILKWHVFPIFTLLVCVEYIAFLVFQFVACDADWNFVTKIIDAIGETTFGKKVDGYIAVIDSGIFVFLTSIIIPNFFVKPWDIEKRNADKQKRIEKYIVKHKLL